MPIVFAILGLILGVAVVTLALVARQFVYVCRPNEVLIFSGRQYVLPDGSTVGYRVLHGGFGWRVPMLEKVDRMDLTTMPIELNVQNAYSRGGIPLAAHAIANVKISSDRRIIGNAIERFLGQDPSSLRRVAQESLEGHVRGIIARMTPEEVNEDRLKFADELVTEATEDFERLGLQLDTLKIQSVSDEVAYLDSIGRERLARVLSEAEIAESTAKADAEQATALASQEGTVANERTEMAIRISENRLAEIAAALNAQARSEEERAEQAALTAKARAEQTLQEIRGRLEALRLQADVVIPADAERRAKEMSARAAAAPIVADGQAMAEVLQMMTETWLKAGEDARDVFLIQRLETIIGTVAARIQQVQIGHVTLIDGGQGMALPEHVASLPAAVAAVLREMKNTTGIDVPSILARREGGVQ